MAAWRLGVGHDAQARGWRAACGAVTAVAGGGGGVRSLVGGLDRTIEGCGTAGSGGGSFRCATRAVVGFGVRRSDPVAVARHGWAVRRTWWSALATGGGFGGALPGGVDTCSVAALLAGCLGAHEFYWMWALAAWLGGPWRIAAGAVCTRRGLAVVSAADRRGGVAVRRYSGEMDFAISLELHLRRLWLVLLLAARLPAAAFMFDALVMLRAWWQGGSAALVV